MITDTVLRIRMEALVSEREAMLVANKQREIKCKALAYREEDFQSNANQLWELGR